MKTVAIVQTRIGSSRLPGKVLMSIGETTMIGRVVSRLRAARSIDAIVIATTFSPADDRVEQAARDLDVDCFRGSEHDVLSRYAGAARWSDADAIVRVTSDCPLLDPDVIDGVVALLDRRCDYASNTHVRSFPRGLDVEALHRDALERIDRMATSSSAREHVTAHVLEAPHRFVTKQLVSPVDNSDLRWTVDTEEDLETVRRLAALDLPYPHLVLRARADVALRANEHVAQKPTFAA